MKIKGGRKVVYSRNRRRGSEGPILGILECNAENADEEGTNCSASEFEVYKQSVL